MVVKPLVVSSLSPKSLFHSGYHLFLFFQNKCTYFSSNRFCGKRSFSHLVCLRWLCAFHFISTNSFYHSLAWYVLWAWASQRILTNEYISWNLHIMIRIMEWHHGPKNIDYITTKRLRRAVNEKFRRQFRAAAKARRIWHNSGTTTISATATTEKLHDQHLCWQMPTDRKRCFVVQRKNV